MKEINNGLNIEKSTQLLPDSHHIFNDDGRTIKVRTSIGHKFTPDRVKAGIYKYTEEIIHTSTGSTVRRILVQDTLGTPAVRGVVIERGEIKDIRGFGDNLTPEQRVEAAQGLFDAFAECNRYFKVNSK